MRPGTSCRMVIPSGRDYLPGGDHRASATWIPPASAGIPSLSMTPARDRPPYLADERTQLVGWLDLQRAIIHWKCEGLSGGDAHRPVLPASPPDRPSHFQWMI